MAEHQCPYPSCAKDFATSYNLSKHINSHHLQIKSFHCLHCGKNYGYKHSLRQHIETHHKTQVTTAGLICVPSLCELLKNSEDPDLRPYEKPPVKRRKSKRTQFALLPAIRQALDSATLPWLWGQHPSSG